MKFRRPTSYWFYWEYCMIQYIFIIQRSSPRKDLNNFIIRLGVCDALKVDHTL